MKHGTPRFLVTVLAVVCLGLGLSALAARNVLATTPAKPGQARSDIIVIDSLKTFGALDQPPVVYLHEQHTKALEQAKDAYAKKCETCHKVKDGVLSWEFLRDKPMASKVEGKDAFHKNCIGCHTKMAAAGQKAGPGDAQCKGCHSGTPAAASNWQDVKVDKRLHVRHAKTQEKVENKCGACHHIYDPKAKKTVAAPQPTDVPGDCGYCHKKTDTVVKGGTPEFVRSARSAAHGKCVNCHMNFAAKNAGAATGPSTCAGCHGPAEQKAFNENSVKKVPEGTDLRIPRGQPDTTVVQPNVAALLPKLKPGQVLNMPAAAFNHKLHETKNESCASCHHASLASCSKECHTAKGAKAGGFVTLQTAMHEQNSAHSCVGCHAQVKAKAECAGCHSGMPKRVTARLTLCDTCHVPAPAGLEQEAMAIAGLPEGKDATARKAHLADKLFSARKKANPMALEDIPETVVIDDLAKDYQPSQFPHRKIVQTMLAMTKDNSLAQAFHNGEATFCQGCHHNTPLSKKPPRCGNCHGMEDYKGEPPKPALKAAFHGQCMGCHTKMGIEGKVVTAGKADSKPVPKNTDCAGCHKEAKK